MRRKRARENKDCRCPACGEPMKPTQVYCFACGFSYRDPRPAPRKRLSLAVPVLFALVLVVIAAVLLAPQFTGRAWRAPFEKAWWSQEQGVGSRPPLTPQQRQLTQDCRREVAELVVDVARLRQRPAPDSVIPVLNWAEEQLAATRRMAAVFAVVSDSEALSDVAGFLRERLERVRVRLAELDRREQQ